MAAIYSNGGNRWNILGFNFTKRDALSSVYKISMVRLCSHESETMSERDDSVLVIVLIQATVHMRAGRSYLELTGA
jgi:hypothetical protein